MKCKNIPKDNIVKTPFDKSNIKMLVKQKNKFIVIPVKEFV